MDTCYPQDVSMGQVAVGIQIHAHGSFWTPELCR